MSHISELGNVRSRKMFGEYAIYYNEKVVALVCDNILFVKITEGAQDLASDLTQVSLYPEAKPYWYISDQKIKNSQWLMQFIHLTGRFLPIPKKRKQ